MTALAKAGERETRGHKEIRQIAMKASAQIWKNGAVCIDSTTGLAEAGTNAANKIFAGVAVDSVLTGASGGVVDVYITGAFKFTFSTLDAADVGKHVHLVDDNTLDDAPGATPVIVGIAIERESSTVGWVEIKPFGSPASVAAA